ncbi:MAG: hypothetical protein ABUJ92_11375, partial [Desulfobacterales bacterium]
MKFEPCRAHSKDPYPCGSFFHFHKIISIAKLGIKGTLIMNITSFHGIKKARLRRDGLDEWIAVRM